ncbi:Polyketide synthase-nonribosomal peptide synthetase hybrid himA, partial [Dissostichus eleginoides]
MPCLVAKDGHHRTYSAPLIHCLNTRCQQLFGETVEENFRAPAEVDSNELLDEEVVQPGQPTPDPEADEAYQSDGESHENVLDAILPHITLVRDETSTVNPPAFEDACSQNPLPGFQELERFCSLLVEIGLVKDKLSLVTEQRNTILAAWNAVEDHDIQQQKFNQLYCRTKRHNLVDAAVIQRVKMAIRYAPAQQDISAQNNRLMYTLVKLLWLKSPQGSRTSPEKTTILKVYKRIQHRVLVDDPVLCKAGFPLPKINIKTVRDFIRAQERLLNLHITATCVTATATVSKTDPSPQTFALSPSPSTATRVIAGPSTRPIMPASQSVPGMLDVPYCLPP